ncbi:unnamed protein product [Heligmosomoides polygyrus]|uniref:HORMA domain-containing protein n=1 Tax=Heligmosomoides polygyrus TaxID=6339 RepID=A0A183GEM0_HELPZ|nr:unnamed protein product [Heligmosomoides polygyrus]
MSYLLFIHFFRWLILTKYYLDITGPMMVSVQKITTLAFSIHDGKVKKAEELTEIQLREAITEVPSLLEYMSYIFNFQTALTGPVNFYSDYVAFLDGQHVVPTEDGKVPSAVSTAFRKLAESVLYLLIIAKFGALYPAEIIAEPEDRPRSGRPSTVENSIVLDAVKEDPEMTLAIMRRDSAVPIQQSSVGSSLSSSEKC